MAEPARATAAATSATFLRCDACAMPATRASIVRWPRTRALAAQTAPLASVRTRRTEAVRPMTRARACAIPAGRARTASGCSARARALATASAPMQAAAATRAGGGRHATSPYAQETVRDTAVACVAPASAMRDGPTKTARWQRGSGPRLRCRKGARRELCTTRMQRLSWT